MSETEKKSPQIYIAVPCFGGVTYVQCWSAILRLTHLLGSRGIGYAVDTVMNESLVQRARNMLGLKVMCRHCSHVARWSTRHVAPSSSCVACGDVMGASVSARKSQDRMRREGRPLVCRPCTSRRNLKGTSHGPTP